MSILRIGQQSKYYQCSPGNLNQNYINPYLSQEQKMQLMIKKQSNQNKYREILLEQIKQREIKRKQEKKKILDEEIKHQRDFYQKIQKVQNKHYLNQIVNKNKQKNQIKGQQNHNEIKNYYTGPKSRLKLAEDQKLSYLSQPSIFQNPKLIKKSIKKDQQHFHFKNSSNHYLAQHSLIDIGRRLRTEKNESSFAEYGYLSLSSYDDDKIDRNNEDMKQHLKQKVSEVYDMLAKSKKVLGDNENKVRMLRKRLKTEPIYVFQEAYENDFSYRNYGRGSLSPKLELHNYYEKQEQFYRIPSFKKYITIQDVNNHERQVDGQNPEQQRFFYQSGEGISE